MRALVFTEIKRMEIQDIDRPVCGPDDVLIEVAAAGICGSDLSGYLGHQARRRPPLVLGHELSGHISAVGAEVQDLRIGERVCANPLSSCGACPMCRAGRPNLCPEWQILGMDRLAGAMAEFVRVPARSIRRLTGSTTDARAACIEPVACGVHLLSLAAMPPFSSLLIVGAGTQGALIARLARRLGYGPILITDVNSARLAAAKEMAGVDEAINVREQDADAVVARATGGLGVDLAVDAVGSTAARAQAMRCARAGGTVMLLGLADQTSQLDVVTSIRKEQRLLGSFAYVDRDFAAAQALIESGAVDLTPWTEVLPLENGPEAFSKLTGDPGSTLKIVLTP
jgi:2-desacetyl-2-hydroxyethyl bacteriochlorophyllide A dehydrogenase